MKFFTSVALKSLISLIVLSSHATNINHNTKALQEKIQPLQSKASVAMVVTDLKKPQRTLFETNSQLYLQPASTMKILNSIIATDSLQEKAPFTTQLSAYGKQESNTFRGDLVFEMGANPTFDEQQLLHFVNKIKHKNIEKIHGNIIILKSHFDNIEKIPGLVWDELDECYATAVSDVSFNNNCFIATLRQNKGRVEMDWPQKNQPVKLAIQVTSNCHDDTIANTHFPAYGYGIHLKQNPFFKPETLSGCWSHNLEHIQLKRSIHNPDQALKNAIQQVFKKEKIKLTGSIKTQQSLNKNQKFKAWQISQKSPTLKELIKKMLQKSDNHISAHLFKESAYQAQKKRATWENAQNHAQSILAKYQLDDEEASIVDGTGLSRNNRITASQLQKTLITIYQTPKLKHIIRLFPQQSTEDSTLNNRLPNIKVPVFAKTGNLKGVMSLAGYIDPFGKNPKAFTIIINGGKTVGQTYLEVEEDLIQELVHLHTQ